MPASRNLALAVLLCGMTLFAAARPAAEPAPAPQDELEARLVVVEKALAQAREDMRLAGVREADLAARLAHVEGWIATLPGALSQLDAHMVSAREWGFEAAGPNPRSKTAVLDGIRGFAQDVARKLPAVKVKDEGAPAPRSGER